MTDTELLTTAVRETRMSAGIAMEVARAAHEHPEGVPLAMVRESLRYWRIHLLEAFNAVVGLELKSYEIQKRNQEAGQAAPKTNT